MSDSPAVRVYVLNWNGRAHLEACLPSLVASRYRTFETVLIDNGSSDSSVAWTRRFFPQVRVMPLGKNMGFAGANNAGLRDAISGGVRYAALLNNDTRVDPDWLDALVAAADADPSVAICQARQRTWAGDREIRFRFIPEWAEAESELWPVEPGGLPRPVPSASGCAMLLRCDSLDRIGLFDERYFMYVEDVDICLRAWIAGCRVLDVPQSIVCHKVGGSSGDARQRMGFGYRNQLSTIMKNYETSTLRSFRRPILRRWLRVRDRAAFRGTVAALRMLPGTLRLRSGIQRARRCPDAEFLELAR